MNNPNNLNNDINTFGQRVFSNLKDNKPKLFNKSFFHGKLLAWSLDKPEFKNNLFRLVDVLPTLKTSESVSRHIHEYLKTPASEIHKIFGFGIKIIKTGVVPSVLTSFAVKQGVNQMADLFIAGKSAKDAIPKLKKIILNNQGFTVDLLGEYSVSQKESDQYLKRYLDSLTTLSLESKNWADKKTNSQDNQNKKQIVNISVKLSALYSQVSCLNFNNSIKVLSEKLKLISLEALNVNAGIYVDAEDTATNNIIYETFKNVFSDCCLKEFELPGIVIQAYARDSVTRAEDLISFAKTINKKIAIRLVKGAYWDSETVNANQNHWPSPLFHKKQDSDRNYEAISKILLDNIEYCYPAFGSHNVRSLAHSCCYAKSKNISSNDFELQMLYGMADPIAEAFKNEGYFVRFYVPLGEILPGMGYLVRRLLENTSNESFLRHTFLSQDEISNLLMEP